jgi:hypothetical protein
MIEKEKELQDEIAKLKAENEKLKLRLSGVIKSVCKLYKNKECIGIYCSVSETPENCEHVNLQTGL